jgi:heme exporter protein D
MGTIDNATWQALGLTLSVLGLGVSALVWRRRGMTAGLRAVAWSLLPLAAGLTGTLRLLWEIGDSIVTWALRLAFSPVVWLGIVLAGVSVLLFVVSGVLRRRTPGPEDRATQGRAVESRRSSPAAAPKRAGDDDMAEIEDILKRHGIS